MLPFISQAAISDAQAIWDDETRQMKVNAIYSGMIEGYVPTWERFPDTDKLVRDYENLITAEAILAEDADRARFFNTLRAANAL